MKKLTAIIFTLLIAITSLSAQKKILFDYTKSETANNADWIIDDNYPTPSPAQSGINSSSSETYWQGALSAWGVEIVKRGYYVETLYNHAITYENTSNSQDLSKYDVYVVCEPNNQFTTSEKAAMLNFVSNGGGLFIVADHAGADRDNDGWDALEVWNDFFSTYNNPFGVTFDAGSDFKLDPNTNVVNSPANSILHGVAGDVNGVAFYNGATMTIDKTKNPSVTPLIFRNSYSTTGNVGVLVACATYGKGQVVLVGDSSVPEDETAHDNSDTYPGWYQPFNAGSATGDDGVLMTNATIWLAENTVGISDVKKQFVSIFPNPCNGQFQINSDKNIEQVQVYDNNGRLILFQNNKNSSVNVDISSYVKGLYFVRIQSQEKIEWQKVIFE